MQTGGAGAMFGFGAVTEIRLAGVAADFRTSPFDPSDLTQHWLDAEILNLELYRERDGEPFGSIRVTIRTKRVEEGAYVGAYEVSVFDTPPGKSEAGYVEATGKVACGVE